MNVPKQFHDLPENLHSGVVEIGNQPTPTAQPEELLDSTQQWQAVMQGDKFIQESPTPAHVEQAELPPLESCPEEMRHGYPDCDCDLEGGDPGCTKKPTMAEVVERYGPLKQRERQLHAEIAAHKATREQMEHNGLLAYHRRLRAEKAEAENQELRRKVEEAVGLINAWWAHPSAHSNPVGPMLREVLALLTAKEGQ